MWIHYTVLGHCPVRNPDVIQDWDDGIFRSLGGSLSFAYKRLVCLFGGYGDGLRNEGSMGFVVPPVRGFGFFSFVYTNE